MSRENIDVNRLVDKFLPLLRRAADNKVEVVCNLAADLHPARLDGSKLEASLLHLMRATRCPLVVA